MAAEQTAKSVRTTDILATGRRKTAVARVRLRSGAGKISINGRDLGAYFPAVKDRVLVSGALELVGKQSAVNVDITVDGGGPSGQAGACRLGIARALKAFDAELAELPRSPQAADQAKVPPPPLSPPNKQQHKQNVDE